MKLWIDGICNTCGGVVIETASDSAEKDYMNTCVNPKCENFRWHHSYDSDSPKYYKHKNGGDIENSMPKKVELPMKG